VFAYLNEALKACDQAIWNQTTLPPACRTLGNVLQALGRFEEAMDWQARSVQPQPDRAELLASLGKLYAQQACWTEAIATYQQVLNLQPDHAAACWSLSNIYTHLQQPTEALRYRQRSLELKAEWATAQNYFSLGQGLDQQERWQEATVAYRQAIELSPGFAWSYHHLGVALLQQGDYSQSAAVFRHAIALNPSFAWTYYHLAVALLHQREWQAVIEVTLVATQLAPDLTELYPLLGQAIHQQWQQQEPSLDSIKLIQHYHSDFSIKLKNNNVVNYFAESKNNSADNQSNGETDKNLTQFYLQTGDALMQQKQFDGAIVFYHLATLEAAVLENGESKNDHIATVEPNLKTKLSQALIAKAQRLEAIETHRQRLEQAPRSFQTYTQLVNLLTEQGDWQEAIVLNQQSSVLQGWAEAAAKQYEFTWDWFSHQIADWQKYLEPLAGKSGLNVLEVGSFEGRSTCWLLDQVLTATDSQITCVDRYFQARFNLNIDRTGAKAKVSKRQGHPLDLLPMLPANAYDLIHLDAGSLVEQVQQHVLLCWERLKPGGMLVIDDYQLQTTHAAQFNLKLAIDQALSSIQPEAKIVHQSYQLIIRKIVCSSC